MKMHMGTFLAGLIFLAVGVAFMLEAADVWTIRVGDLKLVGPLALVVIGVSIIGGAMARRGES
jgi:hypothetical protein